MSISTLPDHGEAFSKLSQQEIARALFLGEGTIRNYVNSILSKLGLINGDKATAYALKHNLRGHMGYGD